MILDEWAKRWGIPFEAVYDLRVQILAVAPPPPSLLHVSETLVQQQIQMEAPKRGARLWRNNRGAMQDETGRQVRYGLANDSAAMNKRIKSSDLIGITPVLVTPEHVGHQLGIFTSIEVKKPGWSFKGTDHELAQLKWIELVISLGGIGKFATGPGDL